MGDLITFSDYITVHHRYYQIFFSSQSFPRDLGRILLDKYVSFVVRSFAVMNSQQLIFKTLQVSFLSSIVLYCLLLLLQKVVSTYCNLRYNEINNSECIK